MILKASQRGSAMELAKHLLKAATNEHVEVHDLRDFVADDLQGALRECEAIARGTRCHKHLFSLSLNPPEHEDVPVEAFEHAITKIEKELGLENQPRAIVFHEKEGRRHAHVVFSRIDASAMKAIKLPFYRKRLNEIAKQLYLQHGWSLPDGFRSKERSNPLNFTREEWQQALRSKQDPKALKAVFKECWNNSKSKQQFSAMLRERGLYLARGDRRGIVAMDWRGEVYAVGRYAGVKSKDLKARLGEAKDFPAIAEVKAWLSHRIGTKLKSWAGELEAMALKKNLASEFQREQMVQRHRHVRNQLGDKQTLRRKEEDQKRAARTPKGLRGLWGWITGKNRKLRKTNEEEITWARSRDRQEKHGVVKRQLEERRTLQRQIKLARKQQQTVISELNRDLADYLRLGGKSPMELSKSFEREANNPARRRNRERDRGPDFAP